MSRLKQIIIFHYIYARRTTIALAIGASSWSTSTLIEMLPEWSQGPRSARGRSLLTTTTSSGPDRCRGGGPLTSSSLGRRSAGTGTEGSRCLGVLCSTRMSRYQ